MAVVSELIRTEANGSISFGDYTRSAKAKLDHFQHQGDEYKVKTFKEITKLERNGMFVYESVPGTTVLGFTQDEGRWPLMSRDQKMHRLPLNLQRQQSMLFV